VDCVPDLVELETVDQSTGGRNIRSTWRAGPGSPDDFKRSELGDVNCSSGNRSPTPDS